MPAYVGERWPNLRNRFHPESQFGGFTDIDGAIMFYTRVRELLPSNGIALDVGCGRGTQDEDPVAVRRDLRILRGNCKHVIGIDVDSAGAGNRFIDEFRLIDGPQWPVSDASIDLLLADFVIEHIVDPAAFFSEAARVVRSDGYVCIRTINAYGYLAIASRLVPGRLHARLLRRVQPIRPSEDVFRTFYRCNTAKLLARALTDHGFDSAVYTSEDEPAYLTFSSLMYRLGLLHRRFAPRALRIGLVAFGRRS